MILSLLQFGNELVNTYHHDQEVTVHEVLACNWTVHRDAGPALTSQFLALEELFSGLGRVQC